MSEANRGERRRHSRMAIEAPIRLSTIDPERDPNSGRVVFRTWSEACEDISRGGVRLNTRDPLLPGRRVLLEIDLPGGPTFEAIGRVAWTRRVAGERDASHGLGIEFLGGTPDHLARLETYLGTRSA
jgi:Tfp pilus assembly protein PilZ